MTNEEELIRTLKDKSLSNRERGDALIKYTTQYLSDMTYLQGRETKASGQVHGDGDLLIPNLLVMLDGKVKGDCKNISVPAADINKARLQAAKLEMYGGILSTILTDKPKLYVTFALDDLEKILKNFLWKHR
jgi:hypothetical protein